MNATRRLIGLAGAAMLAASFSSSTFAADGADQGVLTVRSAVVRYDDLDLGSDTGVQALYARLKYAAKRVCGPAEIALRAAQRRRECYTGTLADAVANFGNRDLTALHEAADATRPAPRIAALQ